MGGHLIFIDASAIVAILNREPGYEEIVKRIADQECGCHVSPLVRSRSAAMRPDFDQHELAEQTVEIFCDDIETRNIDITPAIGQWANPAARPVVGFHRAFSSGRTCGKRPPTRGSMERPSIQSLGHSSGSSMPKLGQCGTIVEKRLCLTVSRYRVTFTGIGQQAGDGRAAEDRSGPNHGTERTMAQETVTPGKGRPEMDVRTLRRERDDLSAVLGSWDTGMDHGVLADRLYVAFTASEIRGMATAGRDVDVLEAVRRADAGTLPAMWGLCLRSGLLRPLRGLLCIGP